MNHPENTDTPACPSCGAPRLGHAWDCGVCGAVFDDGRTSTPSKDQSGEAEAPAPAPAASSPPRTGSARRGSSARRAPAHRVSSGGLTALREWVSSNMAVAVVISFVIYIGVIWLFGAVIIGATDSSGAIKNAYRDITGRPLPRGFGPTFAAHFVSRKLVVLNRPDQVLLVLYKDRDGSTDADLLLVAEGALDLFEVPWEKIRTRDAMVGGEAIEVRVLRLGGEGGPHLYLVPVPTADGGRAVEAVFGPPGTTLEVVDEMVRDR